MTSEVAVLNKRVIALAADNAATLTDGGGLAISANGPKASGCDMRTIKNSADLTGNVDTRS